MTGLDRNNYHQMQPLLYQIAAATLSPSQITMPIRRVLRRQRNTEVFLGEVRGVDLAGRRVLVESQAIPYDILVIATGSGPSYFGHESWEKWAPPLKTVEDAVSIRRRILLAFEGAEREGDPEARRELLTFVLVGAGPTGVEMAGAIAEIARVTLSREYRHVDPRAVRIVLVEAAPRVLPGFPESLGAAARRKLERLGIEIRTSSVVTDVSPQGVFINGRRLPARTALWTAGVVATPVGRWLGTPTDRQGRIPVLPDLTVPGHSEVFVVGDAARVEVDGRPLIGLASVAMQEGRYVGAVIRRRARGEKPAKPFRYVDKGNLATIGRGYAVAVIKKLRLRGIVAWVVWLIVHIFYLIGFRNRLLVLLEWGYAYLIVERGARIISPPEHSDKGTCG